ncbi:ATP-binding cassette domain-containing protein [Streptomonospora sp. PA3]|uniref:ATP-binding cassette domain-containing protein n=1 Tax=Streptomonospora sp. PA3 TaxID=2607326 RepID=UPI0012DBFD21|nr:ATP-binding cassette domain-containing protein [Streptomonospora sp. PA3]MUL41904.1 ATP-binding cassette domain-containing protein [Streptomonospora sp. PA3]
MPASPPLLARDVHKRYGATRALDGLDLEVSPGTVHALLGPNGAGKSTAVNVFTTLTRPDSGEVRVAGHDLRRSPRKVRAAIGLVGQTSALDEVLHGRENLVMFGRLHDLSKPTARARAGDLLDAYGLADAADRKVSTYSGGMRRRLDIAAALMTRPHLLFLDEPTTGLDPRGRNEVWKAIRRVVGEGTTVLLTTQYLDEADQLADRITVLGAGRVIAEGTSAELKDALGGDRVIVTARTPDELARAAEVLGGTPDPETLQVAVEAGPSGGAAAMVAAIRALDAASVDVGGAVLRRPTLDEVFLHLTAESDEPQTRGAAR